MTVRVLVVDDQPDVVEMLCVVLERLGLECRTARSGYEALRVAEEFSPELILLDIGLPDLMGYAVARTLRDRGSAAYIVALSGWGRVRDIEQALDCGFDEHLTKPAHREMLLSAIAAARQRACRRGERLPSKLDPEMRHSSDAVHRSEVVRSGRIALDGQ